MTSTLNVAVVGAGYFSQFHLDAWHRLPETQLVAIADHDINKASASGIQPAFTDMDAMLSACQADILDIITPPSTHLTAIEAACRYPLKAIICQKPFCSSIQEAEAAIAVAHRADIPVFIHENFRFQPWYRCMKRCITNGSIGQPIQFTFRLRTGDGQGRNAYLERQPYFRQMERFLVYETGVHWVDTFRYLFGSVKSVYAETRRINPVIRGEDSAMFILEHHNQVRCVFDGNRLLDHRADNPRLTLGEATLEGTGATITLNGDGKLTLRKFAEQESTTLLPAQQWPGFGGDCVYALQAHVANAITNNAEPENLASDYLPVMRLVDTIYESARYGTKIQVS